MDNQILYIPLLGPLEEGIQVEAGEILAEEEVTPVEAGEILAEEEVTPEEEGDIRPLHMTNYPGNNPRSSKAIAESLKHLCRNGPFIEESIDSPLK